MVTGDPGHKAGVLVVLQAGGRARPGMGTKDKESETQSHGGEGKKWGVRRERWKGKSKGCGSDESETQSHSGEGKGRGARRERWKGRRRGKKKNRWRKKQTNKKGPLDLKHKLRNQ
jgi:hypothetical protein